ncbi:nucleotide exchange factor GrpE [Kitasatospora xanthocidica]|uniref:Nucleotide exchange factor GrpE n=1 Tax=Kitasatospora xanthocidica TaxID=83382 RepID=A0A372ZRH2_9ACTN|nr:nucleotide exchange factor GrpE [Kitasatospora xanthocidica]RGD58489.1 nucleotide exchange factor GrpE [Kitasatospora xanthocidica]
MTDAPTDGPADAPAEAPAGGHRPLEIPPGVEDVDLEQAFGRLLFRASLLGSKLTEQKQEARAEQRELLGILVEVDDALAALGLDRELVALGRGAGLEATRRRLLGQLAKAKVRPMRLEGMTADPDLTEIVGTEARSGVAPETVVRTVVTGFFWGDEVLRRAQVVVAAPESEPYPDPYPEPAVTEPEASGAAGATEAAETVEAFETTEATEAVEPETPETPEADDAPEAATPVTRAQPKAAPPRARRRAKAVAEQARQMKRKK